MKQILLTIDGNIPTRSVFESAVALCKRISAELRILQFINNRKLDVFLQKTKHNVFRVGRYLEKSFAAAAYAEAGEQVMAEEMLSEVCGPLKQLLPESEKAGVPFQVSVSSGNPEKDLPAYVDSHQDIIMAIYDSSSKEDKSPDSSPASLVERLKSKLAVPLVIIRG